MSKNKKITDLRKRAEEGDLDAKYKLALYHLRADPEFKEIYFSKEDDCNWKIAVKLLNELKEFNYKFAEYRLNWFQATHPLSLDVDEKEKNRWEEKLCELGDFTRIEDLLCYLSYDLKNYRKTVYFAKKAAELKIPSGQYFLAEAYLYGKGVARNHQKAIDLMLQAAKQNHKDALERIERWEDNKFYDLDVKSPIQEIEKISKELGNLKSEYLLAKELVNNSYSTEVREGVEQLKKIAAKGLSIAQYDLALLYLEGVKISKSYRDALYWFGQVGIEKGEKLEKVALNTYINVKFAARLQIINIYMRELISMDDKSKGIELLKELEEEIIKTESIELALAIGWGYLNGYSIDERYKYVPNCVLPQDFQKAIFWGSKSSDWGNPEGLNLIGNVYLNPLFENNNKETAYKYLVEAYKKGVTYSKYLMYVADAFEQGIGVEKNLNQALEIYKNSNLPGARKGVERVQKKLTPRSFFSKIFG